MLNYPLQTFILYKPLQTFIIMVIHNNGIISLTVLVNSFNSNVLLFFTRSSKGILVYKLNWSVAKVPRAIIVPNLLPITLRHIWFQNQTLSLTNCATLNKKCNLYDAQFSQL